MFDIFTNTPATPVMALFREWQAAHAALEAETNESEDRRLTSEVAALADRMLNLPSADAQDVLTKIVAQTLYGECGLEACPRGAEILRDAVAFVGRA